MPKLNLFFITSIVLPLAVTGLAIGARYPGVVNLKFLGAEIAIDGRSIQVPRADTKLRGASK